MPKVVVRLRRANFNPGSDMVYETFAKHPLLPNLALMVARYGLKKHTHLKFLLSLNWNKIEYF